MPERSSRSHSAIYALSSVGQSSGFLIRESRVRILEGVPYAQMLEWKTSRFQVPVPQRRAGSSPALCTIFAFLAQPAERRTVNPHVTGSSPVERATYALSSDGRAAVL